MRYSAFISYSHRDRKVANWVHQRLESYRIPKALHGRRGALGEIGSRLPPVFKDREELASSSDLAASVRSALAEASSLVVICSPDAARSHWVNEEIRTFRALGRRARIQCLIVRGGEADRDCFPPALFETGGSEPLAADCRPEADGKRNAILKLIAGILGVGFAELRDRDAIRAQRRLALVAAASLAGFLLMTAVALFAIQQRRQAIAERDIARQKTITAERTVDFVESLFQVADPSEAKGESVTAREVLDRGARRIVGSLKYEPSVQAELTATLGEVYGALGLLKQSDALVRRTFAIAGRDPGLAARQFMLLGESQMRLANYGNASQSFDRAFRIARQPGSRQAQLMPRILSGLSEAQSIGGQIKAAVRTAAEAERIARSQNAPPEVHARTLEALGEAYFAAEDVDRAETFYRQAITMRERSQGRLHPRVTENLNTLGNIAYLRRQPQTAERYLRQVLENDQRVLGSDHPDTAVTLNNLARILLEQRKLTEARALLTRALAIRQRQSDGRHDDYFMGFAYDNLGLVELELGSPAAAEVMFRKGVALTKALRHRNLAPTMTDLANALCTQGRYAAALSLLNEARPLMASAYPDDPWRVAWVDNARGYCLQESGEKSRGNALLIQSSGAIRTRWPLGSFYGEILARRLGQARPSVVPGALSAKP